MAKINKMPNIILYTPASIVKNPPTYAIGIDAIAKYKKSFLSVLFSNWLLTPAPASLCHSRDKRNYRSPVFGRHSLQQTAPLKKKKNFSIGDIIRVDIKTTKILLSKLWIGHYARAQK